MQQIFLVVFSLIALTIGLPVDRAQVEKVLPDDFELTPEMRTQLDAMLRELEERSPGGDVPTETRLVSISSTNIDENDDLSKIGHVPDVTEGAVINSEVLGLAPAGQFQAVHLPPKWEDDEGRNYLDQDLFGVLVGNQVETITQSDDFCGAIDVLVVLDKTSSVNMVYENGLAFARQLVESLTLDGDRLSQRFGLITFRYDSHTNFNSYRINFDDDLYTINKTLSQLKREYPRGATCLPSALAYAEEVVYQNVRPDVPMVVFMITDGHSNKCDMDGNGIDEFYTRQKFHEMTMERVESIQSLAPDVHVFPVMIGKNYDEGIMSLLETISEKVFRADQVEQAVTAVDGKLKQLSCKLFARKSEGTNVGLQFLQPVVNFNCAKSDVLVVLDKTGSTAIDYENGLSFAAAIAEKLSIAPQFQRLGLITFGYKKSQVRDVIPLDSQFNANGETLMKELNDLQGYRFTYGKTCVATGLDYVLSTTIPNERRPGTPLFVFLVTDGISNDCSDYSREADKDLGKSALMELADRIQQLEDVKFYPVAIGDNLPVNGISILKQIGTDGTLITASTPQVAVDNMQEIVGRELKCF